MDKLIICGRTNWEDKFYIKVKAAENSMEVLKKFIGEIGDDFFIDNQSIQNALSKYNDWKDNWIPVVTKDIGIDIICGDKYIHMIFYKFPDFQFIDKILLKYFDWAQPKYKK